MRAQSSGACARVCSSQRRLKGGDGVDQRRIVTEVPALVGPSEARRSPIGRAPLAILGRQQPGGLFMKPRRLGEAQARRLDPGLLRAPGPPLRAPDRPAPARAFRPHQLARLLQFGPRPVVIGCALQGGGGGVTQRLHLRVGERKGADLLQQAPMLLRDPGKAIGKLRLVDRLLVQNFEEPGDGLDREAAVAGDDRVQPDKQHRAISGGGRCGELHQLRDLLGRQAADDGDRAVVHLSTLPLQRANSWPPRGRRAAAAGPGMPQPHSQSAGPEARVAGSCLTPLTLAGDADLAVEDIARSVIFR